MELTAQVEADVESVQIYQSKGLLGKLAMRSKGKLPDQKSRYTAEQYIKGPWVRLAENVSSAVRETRRLRSAAGPLFGCSSAAIGETKRRNATHLLFADEETMATVSDLTNLLGLSAPPSDVNLFVGFSIDEFTEGKGLQSRLPKTATLGLFTHDWTLVHDVVLSDERLGQIPEDLIDNIGVIAGKLASDARSQAIDHSLRNEM